MELLLVLPILLGLLLGLVEFSMLWSAGHLAQRAATAGCRVASFPGSDLADVEHAVEHSLGKGSLIEAYQVEVRGGRFSGDEVWIRVEVPMRAAAPDLLKVFGLGFKERKLAAQAVMRKE
jgi:hypothetical protein